MLHNKHIQKTWLMLRNTPLIHLMLSLSRWKVKWINRVNVLILKLIMIQKIGWELLKNQIWNRLALIKIQRGHLFRKNHLKFLRKVNLDHLEMFNLNYSRSKNTDLKLISMISWSKKKMNTSLTQFNRIKILLNKTILLNWISQKPPMKRRTGIIWILGGCLMPQNPRRTKAWLNQLMK